MHKGYYTDMNGRVRKIDDELVEKVMRMLRAKYSIRTIAQCVGVSIDVIERIIAQQMPS